MPTLALAAPLNANTDTSGCKQQFLHFTLSYVVRKCTDGATVRKQTGPRLAPRLSTIEGPSSH
jgi:hypothetical protein